MMRRLVAPLVPVPLSWRIPKAMPHNYVAYSIGATLVGAVTVGLTLDDYVETAAESLKPYLSRQVLSAGCNSHGQLGTGNDRSSPAFEAVGEIMGQEALCIQCYSHQSAAVTRAGELWTWGNGQSGRLAHDDDSMQFSPTRVEALEGKVARKCALGEFHGGVLTASGDLYTWGGNSTGQTGRGRLDKKTHHDGRTGVSDNGPGSTTSLASPILVEGFQGQRISDLAMGRAHTTIITEDGKLFTCGSGFEGCLGHGDKHNKLSLTRVEGLASQKVVQVACGRDFTAAVTEDGQLWTFGNDYNGQLGLGKSGRERSPKQVTGLLKNKKVVAVSCGDAHTVAVTADGAVFSWGYGKEGQLGHGKEGDLNTPKQVESLPPVKSVSCGGGHTAVVGDQGQLYVWGRGRDGQLGRGQSLESIAAHRNTPLLVDVGSKVAGVACGSDHTLVMME